MDKSTVYSPAYHTRARSLKIKKGYDPDKLGQIADEIEYDEGLKSLR